MFNKIFKKSNTLIILLIDFEGFLKQKKLIYCLSFPFFLFFRFF
ncbi:hypothetical protein PRO82_001216 [Candidatus Protochlamydia amoebophila]|nr:hypothetical protein [Candidatus Protochlamydia amoebophila]